jgi:hypothetical protein
MLPGPTRTRRTAWSVPPRVTLRVPAASSRSRASYRWGGSVHVRRQRVRWGGSVHVGRQRVRWGGSVHVGRQQIGGAKCGRPAGSARRVVVNVRSENSSSGRSRSRIPALFDSLESWRNLKRAGGSRLPDRIHHYQEVTDEQYLSQIDRPARPLSASVLSRPAEPLTSLPRRGRVRSPVRRPMPGISRR